MIDKTNGSMHCNKRMQKKQIFLNAQKTNVKNKKPPTSCHGFEGFSSRKHIQFAILIVISTCITVNKHRHMTYKATDD